MTPTFRAFTYKYPLFFDEGMCDCRNVSVKLPCVYLCLSSGNLIFFWQEFPLFIPISVLPVLWYFAFPHGPLEMIRVIMRWYQGLCTDLRGKLQLWTCATSYRHKWDPIPQNEVCRIAQHIKNEREKGGGIKSLNWNMIFKNLNYFTSFIGISILYAFHALLSSGRSPGVCLIWNKFSLP